MAWLHYMLHRRLMELMMHVSGRQWLEKVQICRDREQPHGPCLGLLLFYSDGRIESIGQVRWDRDTSQEVFIPRYIVHDVVGGRDYVRDIQSVIDETRLYVERREWQRLPEDGTIVWWFSQLGDRIMTYF